MMYAFTHWPTPEEAGITDGEACHTWHERVAIATIDGGLDEQAARAVAWQEIGGLAAQTRVNGSSGAVSLSDAAGNSRVTGQSLLRAAHIQP